MDESRVFNPLALTLSRSVYDWKPHNMGTCLVGRLIPTYTWNVLPGDEFSVNKLHSLFKMATPVYPTMDYLYADIAFYFVPYKLVMSRRYASPSVNDAQQSWAGFIGAQDANINTPIPASGVTLPGICSTSSKVGGLTEYLYGPNANISTGTGNFYVNALPTLAYFSIWNENYREPNLQPVVTWSYDSSGNIRPETSPLICVSDAEKSSLSLSTTAGTYGTALYGYGTSNADLARSTPLPTSVFHGYFGSLLPWPQRNLAGVQLPLVSGTAPVKTTSDLHDTTAALEPLHFRKTTDLADAQWSHVNTNQYGQTQANADSAISGSASIYPDNLWADLSNVTAVDIEILRAAITKQHWYEDIARSGNRLDELEYGTFGVRPKDSGCDRPMYLGGKRLQLDVSMVASTNGGTTSGAAAGAGSLGDLGAFSHTNDEDFYFHQGFDTWGCIQMVFTIRAHNLIASGVDRHWMKRSRDEWFWPEFSNLGNQGTYKYEIGVPGSGGFTPSDVLGYQEYGEEWREPRDMVTGLLYPTRSLGFMTYAHVYGSSVTLAEVLDASKQYIDVDRTLSVGQAASGFQFIYQFTAETLVRRSVGKYSVPGVTRV